MHELIDQFKLQVTSQSSNKHSFQRNYYLSQKSLIKLIVTLFKYRMVQIRNLLKIIVSMK